MKALRMHRIRVSGRDTARRGDTGNLPVAAVKDWRSRARRRIARDENGAGGAANRTVVGVHQRWWKATRTTRTNPIPAAAPRSDGAACSERVAEAVDAAARSAPRSRATPWWTHPT